MLAHIEDGKGVRITNNPNGDPHMAGFIKGLQMTRVLYAPDRLVKPLIRTGPRGSGEFREVEWGGGTRPSGQETHYDQ